MNIASQPKCASVIAVIGTPARNKLAENTGISEDRKNGSCAVCAEQHIGYHHPYPHMRFDVTPLR